MKLVATLTACLLISGMAIGQGKKDNGMKPRSGNKAKKVVFGVIKDNRSKPLKGVSTFVYAKDSTILASAVTDADGKFETNGVLPGEYFIKIIYPGTRTTSTIYGFTIKGDMELNLKMAAPENDTLVKYDDVMPKAPATAKKGTQK